MAARKRLDQILVDRGLAPSRTRAQALLLAGDVKVEGRESVKAGMLVDESAPIFMAERPRWVGRGGDKLAGALNDFDIAETPGIWLDCGAATGGFTDVLLSNGAARIYAVDVGYGQIDLRLRGDPRVVVIERFNIRHATTAEFPEPFDGAALDLSFISLRLVLPVLHPLLRDNARILALFKPQFEATVKEVSRGKGIIRAEDVRAKLLDEFEAWCSENGWIARGRFPSRITGRDGNQEYFYLLAKRRAEGENRNL